MEVIGFLPNLQTHNDLFPTYTLAILYTTDAWELTTTPTPIG